jgi:hypothetical protein
MATGPGLGAAARARPASGALPTSPALMWCGALLASMALLVGCGEVQPADVFIGTRSGSTPHAHLTLLVDEEGNVHCNGRAGSRKLHDAELVRAEGLREDLESLASQHASLAARPGSVMSYHLRDENGSVQFADNSAAQPKVLHELALFVLTTAQQVCGLPE